MEERLMYCRKCGRIVLSDLEEEICDVCKSITYEVPIEYLDDELPFMLRTINTSGDQAREEIYNTLVKPSPEFDQYFFDHRDEILSKQHARYEAAMAHGRAVLEGRDKGNKFGVECPYCHATNVRKISLTSKAGSVALWGIFALGKTSKQWHCDKCGSDF